MGNNSKSLKKQLESAIVSFNKELADLNRTSELLDLGIYDNIKSISLKWECLREIIDKEIK